MSHTLPAKIIWLTLFLCCTNNAFAGVFTPPPTDQSVNILGMIFGNNIGQIILGGQANPALMHMFEMFNIIAVTLGTIIVSYVGVVSIVNTAQEGQTMGKKWHSIWIPARAVLGMAILAPTPGSGYSVIQVTIMWAITQGIGAADKLWNNVLADYASGIGPSTGIVFNASHDSNMGGITARQRDNIIITADDIAENILNSAVTSATLQHLFLEYVRTGNNDVSEEVRKFARAIQLHTVMHEPIEQSDSSVSQKGTLYIGVPGHKKYYNLCGEYDVVSTVNAGEFTETNTQISADKLKHKAQELTKSKLNAIANIYAKMFTQAQRIVEHQPTAKGYRALATNSYLNAMSSLVRPQVADYSLQNLIEQKSNDGWFSAGGFYFRFNKVKNSGLFYSVANDSPKFIDIPKCSDAICAQTRHEYDSSLAKFYDFLGNKEHLFTLAHNLHAGHLRFTADDYRFQDVASSEVYKKILQQVDTNISDDNKDKIYTSIRDLVSSSKISQILELMENKNADPLYILSAFGNEILLETEDMMLDFLKHPDKFIAKIRKVIGGDQEAQKGMQQEIFITTLGIGVFLAMWTAGASLALYVPFIPFLIYTVASIGWLMLVIEAIVAAPLLAISFILPTGEELGKIMQGMMILLNIMLRPALMLFGFVLASRLFRAVFYLVHYGLLQHISDLVLDSSILGSVALIVMYITFVVSLSNRCFSLIYAIPDKALRWVGGAPEQTDISQESQAAKGGIQKAGDIAQKVASGAAMEDLYRRNALLNKYATPTDSRSSAYRPAEEPEYAEE